MGRGVMASLLSEASARYGGRTALTFLGGNSHSFEALDDLAGRIASGLAAKGVGRGDRVLLHLPNSVQWVVFYHAIARLGAVVIPANAMATRLELDYMAQDAEVACIVTTADNAAALQDSRAVVVACDGDNDDVSVLARSPYREPEPVTPDELFTISYTSGTTGRPKGVMLSHGNVFQSMAGTATFHVRHGGDVAFSALPFPHVYGNIVLNAVFLTGMQLIAAPRFDAGEALRTIRQHRVTLLEGVPTMYYQLLAHPDLAAADLTSLTRCTVGGQTMPPAKQKAVEARFGCPLLELWGMTELAGPATTHSPGGCRAPAPWVCRYPAFRSGSPACRTRHRIWHRARMVRSLFVGPSPPVAIGDAPMPQRRHWMPRAGWQPAISATWMKMVT
jgi:long-chain acyl-CoA synthetase